MKLKDFDFRIWTENNVRVMLKTLPCEACGKNSKSSIKKR